MTAAISAQGLTKRFKTGRTHAVVLKSVDFEAEAGHVHRLTAPGRRCPEAPGPAAASPGSGGPGAAPAAR